MRPIYINTVVFAQGKLSHLKELADRYQDRVGFEILAKFDEDTFEKELEQVREILKGKITAFHGPVFGAEHSAPRGSEEYRRTMDMMEKTLKYCRIFHAGHLTFHLNNQKVTEDTRQEMLSTALENYREIKEIFGAEGIPVYVENSGIRLWENVLVDQEEFIALCKKEQFEVLIDIGHANANGWDLMHVIDELKDQIRAFHFHNNDGIHDSHARIYDGTIDFDRLIRYVKGTVPEAEWILEYCNPAMEGKPLTEDLEKLIQIAEE